MNFLELVKKRTSVRKFSDKKVDRQLLENCVESARLAPSACNSQPWHFYIADTETVIDKIRQSAFSGIYKPMEWVCNAPAVIIVCRKNDIKANLIGTALQGTQYYLIDCGIAGEHFVLQAEESGLSTCWIGWFNSKKLKKKLNLKLNPVYMIALGYSAEPENKKHSSRKPLKEIMEYLDS